MNSCYSLSELISFENMLIKNYTEHFMTELKEKKEKKRYVVNYAAKEMRQCLVEGWPEN